jgi:hypothetical protein
MEPFLIGFVVVGVLSLVYYVFFNKNDLDRAEAAMILVLNNAVAYRASSSNSLDTLNASYSAMTAAYVLGDQYATNQLATQNTTSTTVPTIAQRQSRLETAKLVFDQFYDTANLGKITILDINHALQSANDIIFDPTLVTPETTTSTVSTGFTYPKYTTIRGIPTSDIVLDNFPTCVRVRSIDANTPIFTNLVSSFPSYYNKSLLISPVIRDPTSGQYSSASSSTPPANLPFIDIYRGVPFLSFPWDSKACLDMGPLTGQGTAPADNTGNYTGTPNGQKRSSMVMLFRTHSSHMQRPWIDSGPWSLDFQTTKIFSNGHWANGIEPLPSLTRFGDGKFHLLIYTWDENGNFALYQDGTLLDSASKGPPDMRYMSSYGTIKLRDGGYDLVEFMYINDFLTPTMAAYVANYYKTAYPTLLAQDVTFPPVSLDTSGTCQIYDASTKLATVSVPCLQQSLVKLGGCNPKQGSYLTGTDKISALKTTLASMTYGDFSQRVADIKTFEQYGAGDLNLGYYKGCYCDASTVVNKPANVC